MSVTISDLFAERVRKQRMRGKISKHARQRQTKTKDGVCFNESTYLSCRSSEFPGALASSASISASCKEQKATTTSATLRVRRKYNNHGESKRGNASGARGRQSVARKQSKNCTHAEKSYLALVRRNLFRVAHGGNQEGRNERKSTQIRSAPADGSIKTW